MKNATSTAPVTKEPKAPKTTREVPEDIKGMTGVSTKIRALNALGWDRGEIARALNKRYQHVRNVLTTPLKKPTATEA